MKTKKQYLAFLIGNNTTALELVKVRLEKITHIKVLAFKSVYKALEKHIESPNFILFDDTVVTNEGLSSISFFKEYSPTTKIIALSNQQNMQLFEKALELGVDKFYSKDVAGYNLLETYIADILKTARTKWLKEKINSLRPKQVKKEKTIYILDDSSLTSFTIDHNLTKNSIDAVYQFNTVKDFQETFKESKPDVVVLDYYLNEELNGLDILKQIKEEAPETVVIMMSSQQDARTAAELLAHGANHYFIKSRQNIEQLTKYISQLEITTQKKRLSVA